MKIGKDDLLLMTSKEICGVLNENIKGLKYESDDSSEVKGIMIDKVRKLFDNTVNISSPYYTNNVIDINFGRVNMLFSVGVKNTGETIDVSRLRKKDIKEVGGFKLKNIEVNFYEPNFEELDINNYTVKVDGCYSGPEISLKHSKVRLCDMLSKDALLKELETQNEKWKDIRKTVILNMSQPMLKVGFFNNEFNQENWDKILKKN